jgi:outer membrane protein TolC
VRERYDAGLAGITDVLRAAHALLDAEALAVSARVDTHVSTVVLKRALGRL